MSKRGEKTLQKKKYYIAFVLRSSVFVLQFMALCLSFGLTQWYKLTYYTQLSNLLVLGLLGYLVVSMWKKDRNTFTDQAIIRSKAMVTLAITLTFIVYAVLLAPIAEPSEFYTFQNLMLHYITPLYMIVDWLMFDARGHYKKFDSLIWTVIPIIYVIFSLVKGRVFHVPIPFNEESPYPYFFLNVDIYGWSKVIGYIAVIAGFYLILGSIFYSIKMYKKQVKTETLVPTKLSRSPLKK